MPLRCQLDHSGVMYIQALCRCHAGVIKEHMPRGDQIKKIVCDLQIFVIELILGNFQLVGTQYVGNHSSTDKQHWSADQSNWSS